jgi:DNA topoisomerase I
MNKWKSLVHNGIIEQAPYNYRGLYIDSTKEEILWNYARYINTDYWKSKIFQNNFLIVLKKYIDKNIKSVNEIVPFLKEIHEIQLHDKEDNKILSKEDKERIKNEKQKIKDYYGYAIIDGSKQPLGMYQLEPCGVFIGRGESPLTGCWKERNYKSDVTLNISKDAKIPEGNWKKVIENKNSLAIADYDIKLSNGKTIHKSVLFGSNSIVKQSADQHKFEKAKKVLSNWSAIDKLIQEGIKAKKDVALVTWLVKNLGIRIGDEKDPEMESETFGASTLLGKHLKIEDNKCILSFLGKDSVQYKKEFIIPDYAIEFFRYKKDNTDNDKQLFPKVKSKDVSDFLGSVVDDITPKVFRTAWGSYLLAKELSTYKVVKTDKEKVLFYNECNLSVAKQLNHQKNVGKNFDSQLDNLQKRIDLLEKFNDTLKKDKEFNKNKIIKNNKILKELKESLAFKKETKNYALGTSKTNYSDPRIAFSFCVDINLPIDRIYTKALQTKFEWAKDVDKSYYKNYTIE